MHHVGYYMFMLPAVSRIFLKSCPHILHYTSADVGEHFGIFSFELWIRVIIAFVTALAEPPLADRPAPLD